MSKLSKIKEKNKEEENQATPVSLVDLIDDKSKSTISSIFSRVTTNTEFELMFYNYKDSNKLGLEKFLKILNYLNYKSRKEKLTLNKTTTLDVIYQEDSNPDTRESFRATIVGTPAIARYTEMLHDRKNHVIISVLANRSLEDSSIILVKKVKDSKNIINVDDFDLRFRLSQEVKLSKQEFKNITELDHTKMGNITFRYKQRVSLNLLNTNSSSNSSSKETTLSIDLTTVKTNNNLNFLESSNYSYELEIDLSSNSTTSIPSKYLNTIYENAELLLKILDQTNFLITNTEKSLVISKYADLLSLDKKNLLVLDGRKAESLEIQHVVDKLPNLYAVTDKADGDRYFLIIVDDRVYLISYNLHVK